MAELQRYETVINGHKTVLRVTERDARLMGLSRVPENKARQAVRNKADGPARDS